MNRQLDQELHELAAPIELPRGDVGAVVERAQQRRRRMRGGIAVMTTVSIAAAAVVVAEVAGRDHTHNSASGHGTVISLGAQPAAKPLVWRQVPVSSTLGLAGGQASGDGPIYALSTAPGQSDTKTGNAVYKSVDGVDWSEVASPGNNLFLSSLAPSDNRIYAVGTGPATADPNSEALYAGVSDDGAKTWSKQKLPIDLGAMAADTTGVGVNNASIAAGARGSVIVAQLAPQLNVRALLPAGVTTPYGSFQTPNGIEILGPPKPCPAGTSATPPASSAVAKKLAQRGSRMVKLGTKSVVGPKLCFGADGSISSLQPDKSHEVTRTLSWHDLGVTGDLLAAVRGDEFVFFAAPGSTDYRRIDLPQLSNVSSLAVLATNDGFDLIASVDGNYDKSAPTGRMVALHSTDGQTWAQSDNVPAGVDSVYGVGQFDGSIVVFGSRDGTPAVFIENQSGAWTMTSLAQAAGSSVPSGSHVDLVDGAVGPFGLVAEMIVTPNISIGNVKTTLPPNAPDTKTTGFLLLSSADGQTWSTTTLDSLAGPHSSIQRLDRFGDHVVMVASVLNPGDKEATHVAFVGTPAS
jgi:hypothetical protein